MVVRSVILKMRVHSRSDGLESCRNFLLFSILYVRTAKGYWYFTERNGMERNGTYGINRIENKFFKGSNKNIKLRFVPYKLCKLRNPILKVQEM